MQMKMFHYRVALFSLTLAISIYGIFLKKRKEWMNLFPDMFSTFPLLTYMSISHTHTAGALVDIHISASCRMSSVAHTHSGTHTQWHTHTRSCCDINRKLWIPQCALLSFIAFYGAADILLYYYARYVRSFFFLLLPGLSTQPTGRRVCTWNILTM